MGHPRLGHIREYPSPRGWIGSLLCSRSGRSHPMLPALTKLNSVVIGSYFKVRPDKRTTKNVQLVFATLLQDELNSDIARCCAIEWCAYTTITRHCAHCSWPKFSFHKWVNTTSSSPAPQTKLNSAKQRKIIVLGTHLCTRIWVRAMIGLLKKPLLICQSGWREIRNRLPAICWVR